MAKKYVSVAGVVLRDDRGRYLLVQERQAIAYGLWNLPAGHVDPGETPQEAAIREAQEETGFKVELKEQEPILVAEIAEIERVLYAFSAKIMDGELTFPKDELLDAQWFDIDTIKRMHEDGKIRSPWIMNSILIVESNK
jgi:8-oxo-dGTP pyrophosphatase MutT (NUDIX family)